MFSAVSFVYRAVTRPLRVPGSGLRVALAAVIGLGAGIGALATKGTADPVTLNELARQARTPGAQPGSAAAAPSFTPLPPPSLNFYGVPGLVDMPTAEMLPDGQFTAGVSYFGGQGRYTLSFQAFPWMLASFRYNSIENWNLGGFETYYDRGFDVRFRLLTETRARPELTLGLQDFVGTGIYAGEYIVATKRFENLAGTIPGRLKLTAGLGWGRLGSYNGFSGFGDRPAFDVNSTGGEVSYDQWFRGPFALFGGLEYQPSEKFSLKLEYSSDDYVVETQTTSVFEKKSPFNLGLEYQWTKRTRVGAYFLYGSELGLNLQFQMNPRQPVVPFSDTPTPGPLARRPSPSAAPQAWGTGWAASTQSRQAAASTYGAQIAALLKPSGIIVESLDLSAHTAQLRIRNQRYTTLPTPIGRAARAMAQVLPASVETFHIVPTSAGMGLAATSFRRSDLEALEFDDTPAQALWAVTGTSDVGPAPATAVNAPGLYPDFGWSIAPYFSPAYFDPDRPFRLDVGVELNGAWRPGPGWIVAGSLRQRIAGNVKDGRPSSSVLPHVRTDQVLYAQYDTTLNRLYAAKYWQPGTDLYARVTGGYLETMYGGLSTEVLWKPVNSRLALGVEANYVRQRDYDQRFDFLDYSVTTGHASAYYDFGRGYEGQIDVGRYLAGDVGATFSMDRRFNNGWSVGAFFTLTDVSSEDFGEGSFDKGIRFSIPLSWMLGQPSTASTSTVIRPVQRDGGQRVSVPGRLYDQVRPASRQVIEKQWSGVWE